MASSSSESLRVLHIEDDEPFAELATDMLERTEPDLAVRTAPDAETGLDRLSAEEVDCVVSDFDMPGMNGIEFLRAVRERYPDLPFVLFTGKGSEEVASEAITAGVTDYIRKSGDPDRFELLAKRVSDAVERYRSEERYHNLIDTAPVPIALFGSDQRLVYANDAAVEFLEADAAAAVIGEPMPSFVHPDDHERAVERFGGIVDEDEPAPATEFRIRTVDGESKPAVVATAPGDYDGEKVAQVVVRTPMEGGEGEAGRNG
jgi:PAS domain S-box-containing protein